MHSEDESCSECKMELTLERWNELLLNWLNKCVGTIPPVTQVTPKSLTNAVDKYKKDFCVDDIDRAMLCRDDVEPFLRFKYPLLALRYIDEREMTRKLFIMGTILLHHCCVFSQSSKVDDDICANLEPDEQELILKFCENLARYEITIYNIEISIRDAYESVYPNEYRRLITNRTPSEVNHGNVEIPEIPEDSVSVSENAANRRKQMAALKFKSSITVLPSTVAVTDTAMQQHPDRVVVDYLMKDIAVYNVDDKKKKKNASGQCHSNCSCIRCVASGGVPCGAAGGSMKDCDDRLKQRICSNQPRSAKRILFTIIPILLILAVLLIAVCITLKETGGSLTHLMDEDPQVEDVLNRTLSALNALATVERLKIPIGLWSCDQSLCQKQQQLLNVLTIESQLYPSLSQCTLLCTGPQLWPYPTGTVSYTKKLVELSSKKLEYKFVSTPSSNVDKYLTTTFKNFLVILKNLEYSAGSNKNSSNKTAFVKKMSIHMTIKNDSVPYLTLNTDESYSINITTNETVNIRIVAESFCGMRNGLETLSQLILVNEKTRNLVTYANIIITDAPSYKYRGLMIDTSKTYVPITALHTTINAMSSSKFNTLHWRQSDAAAFPLFLTKIPALFDYGAYDRALIYTKNEVRSLVKKAALRGIRILIEVVAPGLIGKPWSWLSYTNCSNDNFESCVYTNCTKIENEQSYLDFIHALYEEIIKTTEVRDVFHLGDAFMSIFTCVRGATKAPLSEILKQLSIANNGFMPLLPIIWYNPILKNTDAQNEIYGLQISDWMSQPSSEFMKNHVVVHSNKWDLPCNKEKRKCMHRSWQEMYETKISTNQNYDVAGGEAMLWTQEIDSDGIDELIWPRAFGVAERLWSDKIANTSVGPVEIVRLDTHRRRLLQRGIPVQNFWSEFCSESPFSCLSNQYT